MSFMLAVAPPPQGAPLSILTLTFVGPPFGSPEAHRPLSPPVETNARESPGRAHLHLGLTFGFRFAAVQPPFAPGDK